MCRQSMQTKWIEPSKLFATRLAKAEERKAVNSARVDPPYNVAIDGNVSGLGKVHHHEFAMASGEMTHHGVADFWLCDVWSGQSLMEGCRRALGMTARYPGRGQGRAASAQAAARELLRVLVEIRRRRMQA